MAKVNYRTCDICGDILKTDIRCHGFTNGYRIWNRLFNNKLIGNMKNYSNCDCQSAYCEGLDDALSVLSHRRLHWITINRVK